MPYVVDPNTGYQVWEEPVAAKPTPAAGGLAAGAREPSAAEKEAARQNGQKWVLGKDGFYTRVAMSATELNDAKSADIAADIDRRSAGATNQFADSVKGMDLGGQFTSRGTTPSEYATAQKNLAAAGAQGVGNTGFTNIGVKPKQVTVSGQKPAAKLFPTLSTKPGEAPSKVEQAADQATDALGPAPRVDIGLADRRLGEYEEALGMSREVIDKLLNGPSTAERLGSQTLRSQLALARSAAGGPGAVAGAMRQAFAGAPELMATATEQARQEELSKLTAAGNVASNFAQAALGARGQDIDIAKKNVDSGLQVKDMVTRLTGTQLELDQRNTELMGQMARDLASMEFDWASLDAATAGQALDRYLTIYGIDENVRLQLQLLRESGKINDKDILNGIIGVVAAGASVGAAAAGKPPAPK